jgi:hypothetical protein
MSKSRDHKHRKQRATRKLNEWRKRHTPPHVIQVPIEIVAVDGKLPKR